MPYVRNKKTGKNEYQNPNKKVDLKRVDTPPNMNDTKPPVFTTPTGNKITASFDEQKKAFINPQDAATQMAERQLADEKQLRDIQTAKGVLKPATPEEISLAAQQEQEKKNLSQMITGQPQPSVADRNVQAGFATVNSIIQTFGGQSKSLEEQQANLDKWGLAGVPAKALLTGLGKVTTLSIPFTGGFSLSSLFSKSNAGNIKELNSDASAITGRARLIYADATSRGGDMTISIEQLRLSEDAVRQRYNDAAIALSASPQDIAEGVDFTEEIYSQLVILTSYRQALERQQLTGEKNQALLSQATQTTTPTA